METTTILLAACLGLGLSASTGLNTFVPLLLLSGAARFGFADLGQRFEWLASDTAIIVLIIASVAELIADKVPAVDHFLDGIGTFLRPAAAVLATAGVLTGADVDPVVAAVGALIIGAPTSLGFHTLKAGTRVASSAATFGCANPALSILEDILSFGLTIMAIFAPILVPFALIVMALLFWRVVKRMRRNAASAPVSAR